MRNLKLFLAFKIWILLSCFTSLVSSCVDTPIPQEDLDRTRTKVDTTTKDTTPVIILTDEETGIADSIVFTIYPNGVRLKSEEYTLYRSVIPKNITIKVHEFSLKSLQVNNENLLAERVVTTPKKSNYTYLDANTIVIKQNNTFYGIAADHDIAPSVLKRLNPHIHDVSSLPVGKYIYLTEHNN